MREWKRGDVALVNGRVCLKSDMGWEHGDERAFRYSDYDPSDLHIRPLVVIDPEDREQVERLERIFVSRVVSTGSGGNWVNRMQATLREFANPIVKPEEPTGVGAVVEDANGNRWVRTDPAQHGWTEWDHPVKRCTWARTDAIKVISGGVTP